MWGVCACEFAVYGAAYGASHATLPCLGRRALRGTGFVLVLGLNNGYLGTVCAPTPHNTTRNILESERGLYVFEAQRRQAR